MPKKVKVRSFAERLAIIGADAKEIAAFTGCHIRTAYKWLAGERTPAEFQQDRLTQAIISGLLLDSQGIKARKPRANGGSSK